MSRYASFHISSVYREVDSLASFRAKHKEQLHAEFGALAAHRPCARCLVSVPVSVPGVPFPLGERFFIRGTVSAVSNFQIWSLFLLLACLENVKFCLCVVKKGEEGCGLALSQQMFLMSCTCSGMNLFWVGPTHHCGVKCTVPLGCLISLVIMTCAITITCDSAGHGAVLRPHASGNSFYPSFGNNESAAS